MAQSDIEAQERQLALEMLRVISNDRPLIFRVEDFHWARKRDTDFLQFIELELRESPVVFIVTTREVNRNVKQFLIQETSSHPVHLIKLHPLQRAEIARFDAAQSISDPALLNEIVVRSNGNPLFFEQLAAYSDDVHARERSSAHVPFLIQNIVQARMDKLALIDRMALQICAVFGERFDAAGVRAVMGDTDYQFSDLIGQGFVRMTDGQLTFAHNLLRESVYDLLLKSKKRDLHYRIAQWFEEVDPRLHAEHLAMAESNDAAKAFLKAAEEYSFGYDIYDAIDLLERGLMSPASSQTRFDLLYLKGELLSKAYRYEEANIAFADAIEETKDNGRILKILLNLAHNFNYMDMHGALGETLDAADRLMPTGGRPEDAAIIARLRGQIEHVLGNAQSCLVFNQQARMCAIHSGSNESIIDALCGLGTAYFVAGNVRMGRETFDEAIQYADKNDAPHAVTEFLHMRAWHSLLSLDFEECLAIGEASRVAGAKLHNQRAVMSGTRMKCYALFESGAHDEAARLLEECLTMCRNVSARRYEPVVLAFLARIAARSGDTDTAQGRISEALTLMEGMERWIGPIVYGCVADVGGAPKTIENALDQGKAILANGSGFHNYFYFLRDAINACMIERQWSRARQFLQMLKAYDDNEAMPWTQLQSLKLDMLSDLADGELPEQPKAGLQDMARNFTSSGFGFEAQHV
ncbi:MAG: hypothetical protein AAF479_17310, partial [Pseudomonadota bacterium]